MYYIILLMTSIISMPIYANINEIPIYPSGIQVSFTAPPKPVYEQSVKKYHWQKRKEKFISNTLPIKVNKFIRIINSISDIPSNQSLALIFYDSNNQVITTYAITNTIKPLPAKIFFMDRNSGRKFQGMRDIYDIPSEASDFNIGIIDDETTNIVSLTKHTAYHQSTFSIKKFKTINPKNKLMLQFEILGSVKDMLTRIAFFKF